MNLHNSRFVLIFVVSCVWTTSLAAEANVQPSYEEARQASWILTCQLIEILEKSDAKQWPGTHAWLEDLHKQTSGIDMNTPVAMWPKVEIGALVDHNPNFWRMYFEIAPADPTLTIIHASLLLSQGEAMRAAYILELGQHRPGIPKLAKQTFRALQATAMASLEASKAITREGTKLFDQGDYDGAIKKYRQALELCPQNGWTYYEMGYTLRTQATIARGEPLGKPGTVKTQGKSHDSPEVTAALAKSRRHDPLQFMAYQGSDPEVIKGFIALTKQVAPAWKALHEEEITRDAEYHALKDLSEGLRDAGVYDLAIFARQLMVARRNSYDPDDYPIIAAGLRRLAPGKKIEDILTRLEGQSMTFRPLTKQEKEEGQPLLGSGSRLYMPNKLLPKTEADKLVQIDHINLLTNQDEIAKRMTLEDFGKFSKDFKKIADEVLSKCKTPCKVLIQFTCAPSGHTVKIMHHPKDYNKIELEEMHKAIAKMDKLPVKVDTVEFQIQLTVQPKESSALH